MASEDDIIEQGKEALSALNQSNLNRFDSWKKIGFALLAGKDKLRREFGINGFEPGSNGFRYYLKWLKEMEFVQFGQQERQALENICGVYTEDIEAWYKRLSDRQRAYTHNAQKAWEDWQKYVGLKKPRSGLTMVLMSRRGQEGQAPHIWINPEQHASTKEYIKLIANIITALIGWDEKTDDEIIEMVYDELEKE